MLDHLIFDTTDAQSMADSANVGAYLRSADGTLITHTTVGGKEALDVRIAEGINVEVDLSHVDDSVKVGDGTDFLAINADGSINITDNGGSLTVDAVDLDIRDLSAAQDSVEAWTHDGAGNAINSTSNALNVYITGSGPLTVSDAALANTAVAQAANVLDVADTAEAAVASPLANRKYLFLYNYSNKQIFVGGASVTEANGFPVSPGSYLQMRAGAASPVNFVGRSGETPEIRTLELS